MAKEQISRKWLDPTDPLNLTVRGHIRAMGFTDFDMQRPVIGVINPWSEINPGHWHFKALGEAVKRGIWAAGGFPLEYPTISMCEVFHNISTLIYRNLMAIDTEEFISSVPVDGVVLLSTCDKDVPAQIMGLATANKPAIIVTGGTRLAGYYEGETVACSTDTQKFSWDYKAGAIGEAEMREVEMNGFFNTCGACGVMGTANSVQSIAEALGMTLPGCASIPAVYAQRLHIAEATGIKIVELVEKDIKPSDILTRPAFENAIRTLMALGASTNLVIHLIAMARRAGVYLTLDDFDRLSRETPFITNVKPSGAYTVEELYRAGGVTAVMKEIAPLLDTSVMTVTGKTMRENLADARVRDRNVIRPLDDPFSTDGGLRIVRGSLAPDGAVIKVSAASPHLTKHTGPAAVLTSRVQEDIDRDLAHITADHVIINRYMGPVGAPGMPEVGPSGLPRHLLRQGVRDMVRITDARMSGTSYGTVVLHVAPEAAVGGPLAVVQDGDMIELDAANGKLNLLVDEREIQRRLAAWQRPAPKYTQGYRALWIDQVTQAPDGCDFKFCCEEDWLLKR
ncbi:MAG TPA: dihydroxy-acid dehydratase [Chloroflexi bacterium]|jgi:dihydroxy-acid dehydratase|nr:dihydroxy-acid dehydratase [Chloroflexota bacterium]